MALSIPGPAALAAAAILALGMPAVADEPKAAGAPARLASGSDIGGGGGTTPQPLVESDDERLAALWRRADEAYMARHLPGRLDAADAALDEAEALAPDRYETLWRRSRTLYWRAETSADDDERERFARRGREIAERALARNAAGVEGHYYAAVNAGIYAQAVGVLRALAEGVEGPFLEHLRFVRRKAPEWDDGAPATVMGRYHFELPWPRRDIGESIRILTEVVRRYPRNLRARLYLAEALLEEDHPEESLRILEEIEQSAGSDPAEARLVKERAARLRQRVERALAD